MKIGGQLDICCGHTSVVSPVYPNNNKCSARPYPNINIVLALLCTNSWLSKRGSDGYSCQFGSFRNVLACDP